MSRYEVPSSVNNHLDSAEAAIARGKERVSESSLLRASVLRLRVSSTMPAVRLPTDLVGDLKTTKPEDGK